METHIVSYNCHVFTILRVCWRTECYHFSVLLSPQPFSFFCGMFPSPTFCVPSQFVIRKRKWHILTLTHFDTPHIKITKERVFKKSVHYEWTISRKVFIANERFSHSCPDRLRKKRHVAASKKMLSAIKKITFHCCHGCLLV